MNDPLPAISSRDILAARPPRNPVDPERPYAFLVEQERTADGRIADVATVFLTNRECPFRCLMCDLWKNTTRHRVPPGAIPRQIDHALRRLPPASVIKLYNSGNFFDAQAIPPDDHAAIAHRVRGFEQVIVENHPKLCGPPVLAFRDRLAGRLEVALGLETVHPQVLPALNKQMSLEDFARAVQFLLAGGISVRTFILLGLPFVEPSQAVHWALRSLDYAFSLGVGCCSVIATRGGNGVLDRLRQEGRFAPPRLADLEEVAERALARPRGRVQVDLWEADQLESCPACRQPRLERLQRMNLSQEVLPRIDCPCRCGREGQGADPGEKHPPIRQPQANTASTSPTSTSPASDPAVRQPEREA